MKTTIIINTLVALAVLVLAIIVLVKYEKKEKYELQSQNANCAKCSGHGSCDTSSGKCNCDPGWTTFDCSIPTSFIRDTSIPRQYWEELLHLCPRIADMSYVDRKALMNVVRTEINTSAKRNCAPNLYSAIQKYGVGSHCFQCKQVNQGKAYTCLDTLSCVMDLKGKNATLRECKRTCPEWSTYKFTGKAKFLIFAETGMGHYGLIPNPGGPIGPGLPVVAKDVTKIADHNDYLWQIIPVPNSNNYNIYHPKQKMYMALGGGLGPQTGCKCLGTFLVKSNICPGSWVKGGPNCENAVGRFGGAINLCTEFIINLVYEGMPIRGRYNIAGAQNPKIPPMPIGFDTDAPLDVQVSVVRKDTSPKPWAPKGPCPAKLTTWTFQVVQ